MGFRSPRWSVRWLMLAVALAASALGAERWHRRSMARRQEYRTRAILHAITEDLHGLPKDWANPAPDPLKAAYHAAMRRKYEEASASPWFPAPPDPPEPR